MKKRNIIIAMLLMLGVWMAEAQTISVNETEALATGELEIKVVAGADIGNYIAAGFYVELPEGFSMAGAEIVKSDDLKSDHVVRMGRVEDSKCRVAVYSLSNAPMNLSPGKNGEPATLCTLKLSAPGKASSMEGRLSGVELAPASHGIVVQNQISFNIILQSVKGDVNGDGEVDIADAVCIVNHVVGKPNTTFNASAADVNGDGDIDIADAVRIVNLVVGKIQSLSRSSRLK